MAPSRRRTSQPHCTPPWYGRCLAEPPAVDEGLVWTPHGGSSDGAAGTTQAAIPRWMVPHPQFFGRATRIPTDSDANPVVSSRSWVYQEGAVPVGVAFVILLVLLGGLCLIMARSAEDGPEPPRD